MPRDQYIPLTVEERTRFYGKTDDELTQETAINQFIRRRKSAIEHGIIDNSSVPAGMPMWFYCKWCGILVEILPEDYLFSPRQQCSQCNGLNGMNWLEQAMAKAEDAGLHIPSPERYHHENRKESI